jgi:PAS domain S-box-containing protein
MNPNRVLLVEDNPADVRLLQEMLREANVSDVRLVSAPTLQAGLDLLDAESFDVALVDLSLPDADGLESLERLQSKAPHLPTIVITGRDDSEIALQAVREGAQDYLIKGQGDGHLLVRSMRYASERKRTMEQLRRSELHFRSLLENALDIITVVEPTGIIRYASPSIERVLGYAPHELTGTSIWRLVNKQDACAALAAYTRSANTSAPSPLVEVRVRRKNGTCCIVEAIGKSLVSDPVVAGVVINARDITERKQAQQRLYEANERLRAVIEGSPLAIYVTDAQGRVQSWNKGAERLFGWTEADVIGRPAPLAGPGPDQGLTEWLDKALRGEVLVQAEAVRLRKDGSSVDVNVWTALLRDEGGELHGIVAMVADITERKRLEEQFRHAQKMEAVGRLAGGVAHDFNNLLTVITGYGQLALNRVSSDSPLAADLREVLGAADRAASLTKQLLSFSRRQVFEPSVIDLNALVNDMHRMLHRIIGEDIELILRLSPGLQPVRADRGQIELVLLNLAVNARDAMPEGGQLVIETANTHLGEGGQRNRMMQMSGPCVVLSVTDTGVGMDPKVRAKIFEPFFTTKETGKGTGLGLSTSYGIIRQHGGDIWVYSEPGQGSTFKIYLPVADEITRPVTSTPSQTITKGGPETILVVEDEPGVAAIMRESLSEKGYHVLMASAPGDALAVAQEHKGPIHLLLSDMILNSMHASELSRQIRELRPGIKVLYVSGYSYGGEAGQRFIEPGVAFLEKPFAPEALAGKVREVLGDAAGRDDGDN